MCLQTPGGQLLSEEKVDLFCKNGTKTKFELMLSSSSSSSSGGRFKKEIVVDGQSYLLLIRDEGGPPELQVRMLWIQKKMK